MFWVFMYIYEVPRLTAALDGFYQCFSERYFLIFSVFLNLKWDAVFLCFLLSVTSDALMYLSPIWSSCWQHIVLMDLHYWHIRLKCIYKLMNDDNTFVSSPSTIGAVSVSKCQWCWYRPIKMSETVIKNMSIRWPYNT